MTAIERLEAGLAAQRRQLRREGWMLLLVSIGAFLLGAAGMLGWWMALSSG